MVDAFGVRQGADKEAASIGGIIGGLGGVVINLVYPALLLIFMMTPTAVKAFAKRGPQSDRDDQRDLVFLD
jgi:hypothetical protein